MASPALTTEARKKPRSESPLTRMVGPAALDVHHLAAVEHGDLDGLLGGVAQLLQDRGRGVVQHPVHRDARAQLVDDQPEPVGAGDGVVLQDALGGQRRQQPVDGRLAEAQAPGQLADPELPLGRPQLLEQPRRVAHRGQPGPVAPPRLAHRLSVVVVPPPRSAWSRAARRASGWRSVAAAAAATRWSSGAMARARSAWARTSTAAACALASPVPAWVAWCGVSCEPGSTTRWYR